MTKSTSFRLSDQAAKNLDTICRISGVNRTAAVEMALAEMAVKLNFGEESKMNINEIEKNLSEHKKFLLPAE